MDNYLDLAHSNIAPTKLVEQLISTINTSFISEDVSSYFLDILPSNSYLIIVFYCIYLLLPLTQLQRLTIKNILDYPIKNKGKTYLDWD